MKNQIKTALKLRRWVTLSHHIPGRMRLKYKMGIMLHLATFKTSDIENTLASVPAFKHYKLNKETGSILIEYDATMITPHLIEALFSASEEDAKQAAYQIAENLNMDGINNE